MITPEEILEAVLPDTPDPDLVALLIQRATDTVSRELGYWVGSPKTLIENYYGRGAILWLNSDPVPNTVVVVERSVCVTDPFLEVPLGQLVLEGRRLALGLGQAAPTIRVTYVAGYDPLGTPAPPGELAMLVRQMVLTSLDNTGAIAAGTAGPLQSETWGDYAYTRANLATAVASALGEDWFSWLKRWRRMRI